MYAVTLRFVPGRPRDMGEWEKEAVLDTSA